MKERAQHQPVQGTTRIITKYKPGQKLGTQFIRIIRQAGFEVWGKPIQNLRAGCQNDLELDGYRMTAVNSWIGNSASVAAKHYLKVTDEDFSQALPDRSDLESVIESVMHSTEQASTGVLQKQVQAGKTAMLADARRCSDTKTTQYPLKECDTGTKTSVNIESVKNECALECADGADLDQIKALLASVDPDLLLKLVKEIQNQKS